MTRALRVVASLTCYLLAFICAAQIADEYDARAWGRLALCISATMFYSCFGSLHWSKAMKEKA